jgi:hypothetical protein
MLPDVNIAERLMRDALGVYRGEAVTRMSGDLDFAVQQARTAAACYAWRYQ